MAANGRGVRLSVSGHHRPGSFHVVLNDQSKEVVEGWAPAVEEAGVSERAVDREQREMAAGCPVALRISSPSIVTVHWMFLIDPSLHPSFALT